MMEAKMRSFMIIGAMGAALLAGCGEEQAARTAAPPATPPAPPPAAPAEQPELKPEYGLEIIATGAPKMYSVKWTAKVNSGGYKLKTESVLVEDMMGKQTARIYSILEQPGPGEMVTQAIETVEATYDAGDKLIEAVELSIKRETRGVKREFPALYSIVKKI
jgi:hypothetical protein